MELDPKVLKKLADYCVKEERCTEQIVQKLFKLKIWEDNHPDYIDRLIDEEFLDDLRFTHAYVKSKFLLSKWGKVKIRRALKQKNIPDSFIAEAFKEQIDSDSYLNLLEELFDKKKKTLQEEEPMKKKAKLISFLAQRGFEQELIYNLIED